MALTYTPPGELGSTLPSFTLLGVDGKTYKSDDFANSKAKVIMFICNHCPYVKAVEDRIIQLAREMSPQGVAMIGICSNDPEEYPEDSFDELKKRWTEKQYGFPYLYDETQEVAKAFGAVCTPDFFVFDSQNRLAYRGRLDDSWKNPENVKKQELKEAIELILKNQAPPTPQHLSMGCSIKWKSSHAG